MTLIYTFTLKITVIIYIDDLRTFLYVFKRKWKEKKKKVKGFPFLLIVMIFFLTWSYDISNTLQIISVFQQSNNYIIEIFYWKDCRLSEVVVPICSFWSVHCFAKCVCSTSLTFGLLWLSIHFVSFHQESQDSDRHCMCNSLVPFGAFTCHFFIPVSKHIHLYILLLLPTPLEFKINVRMTQYCSVPWCAFVWDF